MAFRALSLCVSFVGTAAAPADGAALLQTWGQVLDSAKDTPITRVVNLLTEMQKTLQSDMDEDEALYKKLACWCDNGQYEKQEAIKASTAKIEELTADIERLTAKSSELSLTIKETDGQVASDKTALEEATALREKEIAEFHGMETDNVQALENLKAAITVLSKHQSAPPASTVAGGAVFKSEKDSWSLLQASVRGMPWSEAHEAGRGTRTLEEFMRRNGFDDVAAMPEVEVSKPIAPHKFLQASSRGSGEALLSSWSEEDTAVVRKAFKSVAAFVQNHHSAGYFPAYTSQSGEIFGVLKQLEEEMAGDLSEAQRIEQERAAAFKELRDAKSTQIMEGEAMAEAKEDELAQTDNALAEAKEDLEKEQAVLGEDQQFLANLSEMCGKGSAAWDERKQARLEEMKAVAETIEILQADEARDAMTGTYNFVQVSAVTRGSSSSRKAVAQLLRQAAKASGNPSLLVLASSAELDAFTKVKAAIDEMIKMLKQQQEDEVKKNDWCKDEIHANEMNTAKQEDEKAALEARIAELDSTIKTLTQEIEDAHASIVQTQMDLQRATEDRMAENLEFQKTVADQTMTIAVLKKALDRLAKFYDFLQTKSASSHKQTPPVPQMEYSKSKGATGVMEMIEKLVHEAQDLRKESKVSEGSTQAAYEQLVADTNASVDALTQEIVAKSAAKADAHKDKLAAEGDLSDTNKELEGLGKYNGELHQECDYLLRNFDLRQSKRGEEVEALQQAKSILSGASFS